MADSTTSHTVKIEWLADTAKTIDEKYIPDAIARKNKVGVMFVYMTEELVSPGNYALQSHKSYSEIVTAVENGMFVVAFVLADGRYMPLYKITDAAPGKQESVVFAANGELITLYEDGTVEESEA
jgi:hypothetical protein